MKKLLDLFCGAGGCSEGYHRTGGFDKIIGVDINFQPNYPFEFIKMNAMDMDLSEFDVIHASPPCQKYTKGSQRLVKKGKVYPDFLEIIREKLILSNKPYIIENVVGAPLINPITLCGTMFDLGVLRHRLFESNMELWAPYHPKHLPQISHIHHSNLNKMVNSYAYSSVAGNGGNSITYKFQDWKDAMEIQWMTKKELIQAIPPAYTEFIGKQILKNNLQKQVSMFDF